ncbi:MAG: MGMT family protein [Thermodesulfobacteriota bacterium]
MTTGTFERIWSWISRVPPGRVATYGQIARLAGGCTARMVGYALAALPEGSKVPWQRVINHLGRVSKRAHGDGALVQRRMLELEGVRFDGRGRVDLDRYGWRPRPGRGAPPDSLPGS